MTQETYKYRFDPEAVPAQDLEETFMLALLAVESLHSRSRVRMEGRFNIDKHNRTCTIDAATPVGRDLACIFTGFATSEYGERAVRIERIASSGCACASNAKTAPAASMEAST
jgi:hypothetical protein